MLLIPAEVPVAKRTMQPMARQSRRPRVQASVVNLAQVRQERRSDTAERRVRAVLDENRAALTRLFSSGLIFTQQGSRAGRELLSAHQALLRVADLFARLREDGREDDAQLKLRAEEAFAQLDEQLKRSSELTARTGDFLSGRGRE